VPGVSTGLAWKATGGEILFIECSVMPGKGGLTITGKLGDVMKESAAIALSWIRSKVRDMLPRPSHRGAHSRHLVRCPTKRAMCATPYPQVDEITRIVGPLRTELNSSTDVHIHVPAGAIPKDGPSAGEHLRGARLSVGIIKSSVLFTQPRMLERDIVDRAHGYSQTVTAGAIPKDGPSAGERLERLR
jgi:ATP-dependent Lon protease